MKINVTKKELAEVREDIELLRNSTMVADWGRPLVNAAAWLRVSAFLDRLSTRIENGR